MEASKRKYALGYIVNFLEYATYPATHRESFNNYLGGLSTLAKGERSMNYSLLAFGDFDRISVEKIDSFSRYRNIDEYTKRWLGPRQSVLLYAIDDDEKDGVLDQLFYEQAEDDADVSSGDSCESRFIVFTLIGLDSRLHRIGTFPEEISLYRKLIKQQIAFSIEKLGETEKRIGADIDYEVYGSFSSSELVIVWAAEQYVDVLQLVDLLRYLKLKDSNNRIISPFTSTCSLIAQRQSRDTMKKDRVDNLPVKGMAEIQVTFQNSEDGEDSEDTMCRCIQYLEDLLRALREDAETENRPGCSAKDVDGYATVGEFDYSIRLPADLVCRSVSGPGIFHSGGKLHWRDSAFSKHVLKSRTNLFYSTLDLENGYKKYVLEPQEYSGPVSEEVDPLESLERIKKKVFGSSEKMTLKDPFCKEYHDNGIRGIIKEHFPETDGLCDTIDLLYLDYVNNCSNCISSTWANVLTEQFSAVLDHIASLVYWYSSGKRPLSSEDLFNGIEKISNDFKQVISHIAQSRRTIFVVPSCHLLYLGQYDLILHAYYVFQQYLLSIAYQLDSTSEQPELIPLYTIDVIPDIKASMYKIWENIGKKLIISINMPSASMVDFLRYAMVITHETFHFIPPLNRDKRNQVFGMLYFSEAVLVQLLSKESGGENEDGYFQVSNDLTKRLIPIVFDCGRDVYLRYIQHYIYAESDNENNLEWGEYRRLMLEAARSFLNTPDMYEQFLEVFRKNKAHIRAIVDDTVYCYEKAKLDGAVELAKEMNEYLLNRAAAAVPDLPDVVPEELYSYSEGLACAFREASQDIPVIALFELEFVDYLVWIGRSRNDIISLRRPCSEEDKFRVGMVCDYMLSKQYKQTYDKLPDAQWVKNELLKMRESYIELFSAVPEMKSSVDEKQQRYMEQIRKAFDDIVEALRSYMNTYDNLRPMILAQLKDVDLCRRPELGGVLADNFLPELYTSWKKAVLKGDNLAVFRNSLHMIQKFQTGTNFYTNQNYEKRNSGDGE